MRIGSLSSQPHPTPSSNTTHQYVVDAAGNRFLVPVAAASGQTGYISSATQPPIVRSSSYGFHPTSGYSGVHVGLPGVSSLLPSLVPAAPASSTSTTLNGQAYGYTPSHIQYNSHRTHMAGMAYATDLEKKGLIEIQIVELPENRKNWKTVGVSTKRCLHTRNANTHIRQLWWSSLVFL